MKVYWQARKRGQRLMLDSDDGSEVVEVGAVRETPRGFDALAKTNTYDPGRAQRDFSTMEDAKEFVEAFHPWDIFGGDWDLEVEPGARPVEGSETSNENLGGTETPSESGSSVEPAAQAELEEEKPTKSGWQFWKKD